MRTLTCEEMVFLRRPSTPHKQSYTHTQAQLFVGSAECVCRVSPGEVVSSEKTISSQEIPQIISQSHARSLAHTLAHTISYTLSLPHAPSLSHERMWVLKKNTRQETRKIHHMPTLSYALALLHKLSHAHTTLSHERTWILKKHSREETPQNALFQQSNRKRHLCRDIQLYIYVQIRLDTLKEWDCKYKKKWGHDPKYAPHFSSTLANDTCAETYIQYIDMYIHKIEYNERVRIYIRNKMGQRPQKMPL